MRTKIALAVLTILMMTFGGLWLNTRHISDEWQSQAEKYQSQVRSIQSSNDALISKNNNLTETIQQWQTYSYCLGDWGNLLADSTDAMKDAWSQDNVTSAISGLSKIDAANSKLDECNSLEP